MTEERLITKLTMIASQIQHEDDLMGQRTNWLVVSQSFLFGTFVAVIGLTNGTRMAASFAKLLLVLMPLVACCYPSSSRWVYAAANAIRQCGLSIEWTPA